MGPFSVCFMYLRIRKSENEIAPAYCRGFLNMKVNADIIAISAESLFVNIMFQKQIIHLCILNSFIYCVD